MRVVILLCLLALVPGSLRAQATPEAAAEQYIAAMKSGDWSRTAVLMHPAALSELKGFFAVMAAADSSGQVLQPIFRVPNATEFDALPPAEVYSRLLRTVTAGNPALRDAMQGVRAEILGSVAEGPETAHVVYRMHMEVDGVPMARMDVLSFRRSGDRWMALLTGDLRAMAESLSRALRTGP